MSDDELRAIFRDELEDVSTSIDTAAARLEGAPEPERGRISLELRRAFHTLKGAAQAVGDVEVEEACQHAEAAIAARAGDFVAIGAIARGVLPILRRRLAA
ncbi:MAG: Hpt domain-containing protein, partial [Myxococcota bacterium]|nr:Hpt domain-containing protein [Myxococcota bacterium]